MGTRSTQFQEWVPMRVETLGLLGSIVYNGGKGHCCAHACAGEMGG
jgi:hypothetical protein